MVTRFKSEFLGFHGLQELREREENIIWGLTCYNNSPHRGVPAKLLFLVHVVPSLRPARHCDRPSPEMND